MVSSGWEEEVCVSLSGGSEREGRSGAAEGEGAVLVISRRRLGGVGGVVSKTGSTVG
jgi:hypothetical protein